MQGCVLLVDNDPVFLEIGREYFESVGFRVMLAGSASEAREALGTGRVHMMVIDLRLRQDSDDQDRSGLRLAKDVASWIPKIVLTRWPAHQDVREAMKLGPTGQPPAIDFINKEDGLKVLSDAVQQAFKDHVKINWNLAIQFSPAKPVSLAQIAASIDPNARDEALLNRASEVEDLFRRLFSDWEQIRIERLIWSRSRRTALTVFSFAQGRPPQCAFVVCGTRGSVSDEAEAFRRFGPPAGGPVNTTLGKSVQTIHFAANAYDLAGADMENLRSFVDIYRDGTEKAIKGSVVALFQKTIPPWHQSQLVRAPTPQAQFIRKRLERLGEWPGDQQWEQRTDWLTSQLFRLGLKAERTGSDYTLQFRNERFYYPDPIRYIAERSTTREAGMLLNSPGDLSGDNILFDSKGTAWLTDFLGAGMAPAPANFVALECTIRFDLNETADFRWVHAFEDGLVNGPFVDYDASDFEGQLRKAGRAIQEIRRQAERSLGSDADLYHEAVLFEALSRIGGIDFQGPATNGQVARSAHAWISAMMICKRLLKPPSIAAEQGMRLDKENGVLWIDGRRVDLAGIGLQLICVLYEYSNRLCSRRLLIERVFGEKYEQVNAAQVAKLNVAIRRLREKVESDPDHPRYLQTTHGGGYRLLLNPSRP